MKKSMVLFLSLPMLITFTACSQEGDNISSSAPTPAAAAPQTFEVSDPETPSVDVPDNFVLVKGGNFQMGSPDTEAWRSEDETQHTVTVSDFYISAYELTQGEYEAVMGSNPSSFSGDDLPVENIT